MWRRPLSLSLLAVGPVSWHIVPPDNSPHSNGPVHRQRPAASRGGGAGPIDSGFEGQHAAFRLVVHDA